MLLPPMDKASHLCTNCTLCCDGRLFDDVAISEGEDPVILAAGLEIVRGEAGEGYFRLPCHFLGDACCSRYETRFQICRTFSCKLLRSVRAGSVDLASAMSTLAEAKRLLAIVEVHLGEPATRSARDAKAAEVRDWRTAPDGPERTAAARVDLDLITVSFFLERYFYRDDSKKPEGHSSARDAG